MRRQHQIKTEIHRNKLRPRTAIYWNTVSPKHSIGIRRYQLGWAWYCRNGSVHTFADSGDLSYDEALQMITAFWKQEDAIAASYTVFQAIRDYAKHQRLHKGIRAEMAAERTCSRALHNWLDRELASITKSELSRLHESLVKTGTDDKVRASKSSANRVLATIKACFNLAYKSGRVDSKAWEFVTAFPKVDGSRGLLLFSEELKRLMEVTQGAFHNLVKVAILTGARLGELRSAMKMTDCHGLPGEMILSIKFSTSFYLFTGEGVWSEYPEDQSGYDYPKEIYDQLTRAEHKALQLTADKISVRYRGEWENDDLDAFGAKLHELGIPLYLSDDWRWMANLDSGLEGW